MHGALLGDLAGSIYEFDQTKKVHPVVMKELIPEEAFFTDDSILTVAICEAIKEHKDYEKTLREYISRYRDYHPDFQNTFDTPFSPRLLKWARGERRGTSAGNGAMMRISPVGNLIHGEKEIINQAMLATIPSHDCKESIWAATTIALMIYYFKCGYSKKDVYKQMGLPIHYEPFQTFNSTCLDTIDNCLYAFYQSTGLEDAIERTLWMGGDTDTNCCIVGSLAEAYYGMDDSLKEQVEKKIPKEFVKVLHRPIQ